MLPATSKRGMALIVLLGAVQQLPPAASSSDSMMESSASPPAATHASSPFTDQGSTPWTLVCEDPTRLATILTTAAAQLALPPATVGNESDWAEEFNG